MNVKTVAELVEALKLAIPSTPIGGSYEECEGQGGGLFEGFSLRMERRRKYKYRSGSTEYPGIDAERVDYPAPPEKEGEWDGEAYYCLVFDNG